MSASQVASSSLEVSVTSLPSSTTSTALPAEAAATSDDVPHTPHTEHAHTTDDGTTANLLAAMSLSANPLSTAHAELLPVATELEGHPHTHATTHTKQADLTPGTEMMTTLPIDTVRASSSSSSSSFSPSSAPPPSVSSVSLLSPPPLSEFHRLQIVKGSDSDTPLMDVAMNHDGADDAANAISPNTLTGPLATLLGLTPSPSSANSHSGRRPRATHSQSSRVFSPDAAPTMQLPMHAHMHHGTYVHVPTPTQQVRVLTPALPQPMVPPHQPLLSINNGVFPNYGHRVHKSRPNSSYTTLPTTGGMSRAERKQAQQWLDRVQSKQEQAKSWPRALLPTPAPAVASARHVAVHAPFAAQQFMAHPMQPAAVPQHHHRSGTQHNMAPSVQPTMMALHTPLARSRTDASELSESSDPAPNNRLESDSHILPATSTAPSAALASSSCEPDSIPAPVPAAAPPAVSPTAAQIYSAGAIPVLHLTECMPQPVEPVSSRPRSRSLFYNGSAQTSPFTSTIASPLLAAFKDAQAEAIREAQAMRRLNASADTVPATEEVGALTTSSSSPPLLHLPAPALIPHDSPSSSSTDADVASVPSLAPLPLGENDLQVRSPLEVAAHASSKHRHRERRSHATAHEDVLRDAVSANDSAAAAADWEKKARIEYGLPPIPPVSGSFKPMTRTERKQALALLSKVNSKRQQAQSWPRSMLLQQSHVQPPSSPSPIHTPGTSSSRLHSRGSPNLSARAMPDLPLSPRGSTFPPNVVMSPNSTHGSITSPLGPALGLLPMHRSISGGEPSLAGSGATTPSGAHTPGGRSVTLGMGLRTRNKSSASLSSTMYMTPPSARHSLAAGHRLTPSGSSVASPSLASCTPPVAHGGGGVDSSTTLLAPTQAPPRKLSAAGAARDDGEVDSHVDAAHKESAATSAANRLAVALSTTSSVAHTRPISPQPAATPSLAPLAVASRSGSDSPNRVLYVIIGLLTLLLIVLTLLLLKTREESQLTMQLQLQQILAQSGGGGGGAGGPVLVPPATGIAPASTQPTMTMEDL